MGVYIKGMTIPSSCYSCRFNNNSLFCNLTFSSIDRDYEDRERLSDCPMIDFSSDKDTTEGILYNLFNNQEFMERIKSTFSKVFDISKARKVKKVSDKYSYHVWETYEYKKGSNFDPEDINVFAYEYGHHNGPRCKNCGYYFCQHCNSDGWDKEPCTDGRYYCPSCDRVFSIEDVENKVNVCSMCGQFLDWSDEDDKMDI